MNIPVFRALRSRNYRLFFAGQALSQLGTWMQKTAVSWVIYTTTHSKMMLGVSVFATLFPTAVFSLLGGGVADRYNRYRVLLLTQVLSMGQAGLLTLLVYWHPHAVWGLVALGVVLGAINGFDVPARQSLVYELVDDKADLPNALALNSSMVNLAQFVGPAVAGFAIEYLGATACFGLNALSFVAVIGSLLALRLPPAAARPAGRPPVWQQLVEGFRYVRATPALGAVIGLLGLACLLGLPFATLMPVFARDVFHGTATTFGVLSSTIGLGALAGGLYLAARPPGTDRRRLLMGSTFVFGAGLVLFAYAPWYPLALACLAVAAFGMMGQATLSITLLQTEARPDMRGRVISFFVLAYATMLPLGSLLAGAVSQRLGAQPTVLAEGLLVLGLGLLHWRVRRRAAPAPAEALAAGQPVPGPAPALATAPG